MKNDEAFRSGAPPLKSTRCERKGRIAEWWIKMERVGHRWSTVHQASRFTGLQIELARRNIGERVQGAYRDVQVRSVRRQSFLPHFDQKGQDGSSW